MRQTLGDKAAAIESLLGFLFAHLDHVPGAARTARQEWISDRSPLDDPPKPPLMLTVCSAHCHTCTAYYALKGKRPSCPDERWFREMRQLRTRYRIADIECSLLRLGEHDVQQAQAVWAVFVEPWPGELCDAERPYRGTRTEAIGIDERVRRAELAEDWIVWMARDIEGEVVGYGQRVDPIENQIRQLAAQGYTQRRIRSELRCDINKVNAVLRGIEVRCE